MDVELTSKTFIGLYRTFREFENGLPLVSLCSIKATHHVKSLLPSKPDFMALTSNFDTDWSGTLMTEEGLPVLPVRLGVSR